LRSRRWLSEALLPSFDVRRQYRVRREGLSVKRPTRLFTLAMFSAASAAACAAVLGIDDRKLDPQLDATPDGPNDTDAPGNPDDANDASMDIVVFDVPVIPDATCGLAACTDAGGQCINNACQFKCEKGCKNAAFDCPPDSDCQIVCAKQDDCEAVRCRGGKSCAFECNATVTCKKVACSSPSCAIHCKQVDSCKEAVFCDGGVCSIDCEGVQSCDEIDFNGSNACSIRCLAASSCEGGGKRASCGATPDASIYCAKEKDACKDIVPWCRGGQRCDIRCDSKEGCNTGVCCEAGVSCTTDSGTTSVTNKKCE